MTVCMNYNYYDILFSSLADDLNCFGTCQCFALAFGVPAVLMVISLGECVCGVVWCGRVCVVCH